MILRVVKGICGYMGVHMGVENGVELLRPPCMTEEPQLQSTP